MKIWGKRDSLNFKPVTPLSNSIQILRAINATENTLQMLQIS